MKKSSGKAQAALVKAALDFLIDQPWSCLTNEDVFAVEDPHTGKMGYCTVMGSGGEEYGLLVFLGERGWERLRAVQEGAYPEDRDSNLMTSLLSFSLLGPDELSPEEYKLMREAGEYVQKGKPVPFFRSQRPGYAPWLLEEDEVVFLTAALREARVMATKSVDTKYHKGQLKMPARCLRNGHWVDAWHDLPAPAVAPADTGLSAEQALRLRMLEAIAGPKAGTWETDIYLSRFPVQQNKDDRPFFPLGVMLVDGDDGRVIGANFVEPWFTADQKRGQLILLMEKARRLPAAFRVQSETVRKTLLPLAGALGVRVEMGLITRLMEAQFSLDAHLKLPDRAKGKRS